MSESPRPQREFRPRTRRWMTAAVAGALVGTIATLLASTERLEIAGRTLWQDMLARPLILIAGIGWLVFVVAVAPAVYFVWRDLRQWFS